MDPYLALAQHKSWDVGIGGAIITLIEPHAGREVEYNRWYEDDHFYAGVMAGPWCISGKRYLAPKSLRQLRYPANSPIAKPLDKGIFISVYFIMTGHVEENFRWTMSAMYDSLTPMGRGYLHRDHVYTSQHTYGFEVCMDPPPMHSYQALDHPYKGMVLEVITVNPDVDRKDLIPWLRDTFVPAQKQPTGQCIGFLPLADRPASWGKDEVVMANCVTLLWFLHEDPMVKLPDHFATHEKQIEDHGKAKLLLVAPFVPTIVGTNAYSQILH